MSYVIAGVSGNTGSVVASTLLAHGEKVRVLVRDAAKGEPWRARGAEVVVGDLDDVVTLERALVGAQGAYLLSPPTGGPDGALAASRRIVDAIGTALELAPLRHVVFLSSVAAQHPEGTGPIRAAHYAEARLSALRTPVTFLRASYFQENWGSVAQVAREQGILPSFLTAGRPVPQVATADIGRVAAEALLAGFQSRVIELEGPERYRPEDAAAAFGRALGHPVQLVSVPTEGVVPALLEHGVPDDVARLYAEMYAGINSGHVDFEGTSVVRGRVSLEETITRLAVRTASAHAA